VAPFGQINRSPITPGVFSAVGSPRTRLQLPLWLPTTGGPIWPALASSNCPSQDGLKRHHNFVASLQSWGCATRCCWRPEKRNIDYLTIGQQAGSGGQVLTLAIIIAVLALIIIIGWIVMKRITRW
jgi:hypothetical protein